MRGHILRLAWILAICLVVMGSTSVVADDPGCRGGVLYGTVWSTASGGWTGGSVAVYALGIDGQRILASTRTDTGGRYRLCGLPLRTRFQLVAVPPETDRAHVEAVTITLAGGQQRNIYPGLQLQAVPDAVRRQPAIASSRVPTPTIAYRAPTIAYRAPTPPPVAAEYTPVTRTIEATGYSTQQSARYSEQYSAQYSAPPPENSTRVVSGDGLLMYFSGEEPRYMLLRTEGTDGRGCYFEFDWGIDEQSLETSGSGYELVSPAWGRIGVERRGDDRVTIDLSNVFAPVCRTGAADGGPLTWDRGSDGWVRIRL